MTEDGKRGSVRLFSWRSSSSRRPSGARCWASPASATASPVLASCKPTSVPDACGTTVTVEGTELERSCRKDAGSAFFPASSLVRTVPRSRGGLWAVDEHHLGIGASSASPSVAHACHASKIVNAPGRVCIARTRRDSALGEWAPGVALPSTTHHHAPSQRCERHSEDTR